MPAFEWVHVQLHQQRDDKFITTDYLQQCPRDLVWKKPAPDSVTPGCKDLSQEQTLPLLLTPRLSSAWIAAAADLRVTAADYSLQSGAGFMLQSRVNGIRTGNKSLRTSPFRLATRHKINNRFDLGLHTSFTKLPFFEQLLSLSDSQAIDPPLLGRTKVDSNLFNPSGYQQ
jgi:hypothetical protein